MPWGAEFLGRPEGRIKVILRSGPVQGRGPGFPINKDHIVAFAVPVVGLALEHIDGRDAFVASMKRSRAAILAMEKRSPPVPVVHDNLPEIAGGRAPAGIVYDKGAWTLHMLRGMAGNEKFWAGIREYYRRFRDGSASTADFRQVMEEVTGADLAWFFQQWLYRAGSPAVEGTWTYNAHSKTIELELAQTQADVYRLPLDVAVSAQGAPAKIEKIELNAKRQTFEIAAAGEPASVELDPDAWVLMDVKFGKR